MKHHLPFQAMGFDLMAMNLKCPVVGNFMDKCNEKLVGVKVVVNGNLLNFPIRPVSEVPQLTATGSG